MKIVEKAFQDKLKDTNFITELKDQAQKHLDGGQLKGTNREQKLHKKVDKL
ncbi:hypothetical protein [Flavobacterium polysaccharolyticum]|uniref:Uncharacterized protein n=1 Tax=Flavobacterium polysaccharolyticum TaxID=3133148 RepID=A0ABU9NTM1_9FLAO